MGCSQAKADTVTVTGAEPPTHASADEPIKEPEHAPATDPAVQLAEVKLGMPAAAAPDADKLDGLDNVGSNSISAREQRLAAVQQPVRVESRSGRESGRLSTWSDRLSSGSARSRRSSRVELEQDRDHGEELYRSGKLGEAESVLRETVEAYEELHGVADVATLSSVSMLAITIEREGRLEEAEALVRRSPAAAT